MRIVNYNGNVFDSNATIIAHQVNGLGIMGSGVAKEVKDRYPRVYEKYKKAVDDDLFKLGGCQVVNTTGNSKQYIANLCGQYNYGYDNKRYTSYDAIYLALEKLADYCLKKNITSVAFPYKMSCVRGGASWDIIMAMIEDVFKYNKVITIEIWKYDKG